MTVYIYIYIYATTALDADCQCSISQSPLNVFNEKLLSHETDDRLFHIVGL